MKESFPFEENPAIVTEPQNNPPKEMLVHAAVERNRSPYDIDEDHEPSIDIPEAKVLQRRLAPTPSPSPKPVPTPTPTPTPSRPTRRTLPTPEAVPPPVAVPASLPKRRTVEVIESTDKPHLEHVFMKYADGKGTEEIETTSSSINHASFDLTKQEFHSDKKYHLIHTHPSEIKAPRTWFSKFYNWIRGVDTKKIEQADPKAIHSATDMRCFLNCDNMKYSSIALRDPHSGKVLGYNVLSKTKDSPGSALGEMKKNNIFKSLWRAFATKKKCQKIRESHTQKHE